ncbi:hypothetical protein K438DRAFT_2015407 [Mycena galopus ATCC 62051]|nr:hypothetical protein K438DRAFT_2015407 [Mycena galopus ATCC 62051]
MVEISHILPRRPVAPSLKELRCQLAAAKPLTPTSSAKPEVHPPHFDVKHAAHPAVCDRQVHNHADSTVHPVRCPGHTNSSSSSPTPSIRHASHVTRCRVSPVSPRLLAPEATPAHLIGSPPTSIATANIPSFPNPHTADRRTATHCPGPPEI